MLLKKGSHGAEVKHWQAFIGVTPDGDFGTNTENVTKQWQLNHGLDADGKVGDNTIAKAKILGYETSVIVEKPVTVPSSTSIFDGDRITQINEAKLAKVAPKLQVKVRAFIAAAKADGVIIQVTQGLRTFIEQDGLYAQGRTKPGMRVTNARGGQSNHNYGMAVDVAPVVNGKVSFDEKLYKFGKWADASGLSWGGRWKSFTDLPHLELPNIPKPSVLIQTYRNGGLFAVWTKYGAT